MYFLFVGLVVGIFSTYSLMMVRLVRPLAKENRQQARTIALASSGIKDIMNDLLEIMQEEEHKKQLPDGSVLSPIQNIPEGS